MNNDEIIITGQGQQQNVPRGLDVSIANDIIGREQETVSIPSIGKFGTGAGTKKLRQEYDEVQHVGGMSGRIKGMLNSPEFVSDSGFYDTEDIEKRLAVAQPKTAFDVSVGGADIYGGDYTSDALTIVKDSAYAFGKSLLTLGDQAAIALGGLFEIAGVPIGEEFLERAYEALDAKLADIENIPTHEGDVETWTSKITYAAASILEMAALGFMTGGIAPIVQIGVEAFGTGTYNNMKRYADANGGSIDGYEGNWLDVGIDLLNAIIQARVEKVAGPGSGKILRGVSGNFLRHALEGATQETVQSVMTDMAEILKGNEDWGIIGEQWKDYITAALVGGVMQGGLGAGVYKTARLRADANIRDLYIEAMTRQNKNIDADKLYAEATLFAKNFNNDLERRFGGDMYKELAERMDANNDKGASRNELYDAIANKFAETSKIDRANLSVDDKIDIDIDTTLNLKDVLTRAWIEQKMMSDLTKEQIKALKTGQANETLGNMLFDANEKGKIAFVRRLLQAYRNGADTAQVWDAMAKSLRIRPERAIDIAKARKVYDGFKAWVENGGKGGLKSMQSFYETMSRRMAKLYDSTLRNSPSKLSQLPQEFKDLLAANERLADIKRGDGIDSAKQRDSDLRQIRDEKAAAKSVDGALTTISDVLETPYETGERRTRKISSRLKDAGATGDAEVYTTEEQSRMRDDAQRIIREPGGIDYALNMMASPNTGGIRKGIWYNALMDYADETNDALLLDRIQATGIAQYATEAGREVAAFGRVQREDGSLNAAQAIKLLNNNYKQLSSKEQSKYNESIQTLVDVLKQTDAKFNKKAIDLLKTLECK